MQVGQAGFSAVVRARRALGSRILALWPSLGNSAAGRVGWKGPACPNKVSGAPVVPLVPACNPGSGWGASLTGAQATAGFCFFRRAASAKLPNSPPGADDGGFPHRFGRSCSSESRGRGLEASAGGDLGVRGIGGQRFAGKVSRGGRIGLVIHAVRARMTERRPGALDGFCRDGRAVGADAVSGCRGAGGSFRAGTCWSRLASAKKRAEGCLMT